MTLGLEISFSPNVILVPTWLHFKTTLVYL